MQFAPGPVSTEPLMGVSGQAFAPPLIDAAFRGVTDRPRLVADQPPSTATTNPHSTGSFEIAQPFDTPSETLRFADNAAPAVIRTAAPAGHDWAAQIEQMRNDVFGIAMSVSALSDRLDRLEQRIPQGGQSAQAGLATLRGEIEVWLENHLNAAVEHCMHRIANRSAAPPNN